MTNFIADLITFLINEFKTKGQVTPKVSEQLKALPYPEFLNTEYWNTIRKYMLDQAKYKCQLCNSNGTLHVHHKTYEHHGDEHNHLEDLIVLCKQCHEKIHDKAGQYEQ